MKKLLSIILALTLVAGLIPSAFADNTTTEIIYDMKTTSPSNWALGVANDSASFRTATNGVWWTFYLDKDGDNNTVPAFGKDGAFTRAASIELKDLKAGTYNVSVGAVKKTSGAIMEFHLVKKTSEIAGYMTKDNVSDYAKSLGSSTRLGKMDIYAEESAKFTAFYVSEDGDYYLIMIPVGANENFIGEKSGERYFAYNIITDITFSPTAYANTFVYNLNSQAFNLSKDAYSSEANSTSAKTLKYAGTNSSANNKKVGGWIGSNANSVAAAQVRNWQSMSYTFLKNDECKWAVVEVPILNNGTLSGANNTYLTSELFYTNFSADRLAAGTYLTMKINVPVVGKYNISITPKAYSPNALKVVSNANWVDAAADIYVVSPTGYAAESWLSTDKITTVRYFTDNAATGTFEVAEPGDYYVVFDYNNTDEELTKLVNGAEIAYYVAQTKSITLTRTGNTVAENAAVAEKTAQQSVTGNPATASGETESTAAPTVNLLKAFIGGEETNKNLENEATVIGGIYTVKADKAPEGYSFLYWTKGLQNYASKRIVSVSETVTFKPEIGGNYLIAVYGKNGDNGQEAKYYNANGQLLENSNTPSMPGYGEFKEWVDCGNNIFMADYECVNTYDITIKNDSSFKEKLTRNYGEEVTVTAPARASDGYRVFAYWEKGEGNATEIVSFDKAYTFYAFEDCTVNAVYKEYAPLVTTLRKIILTNIGGSNYMAEFIGFGDAIEKGIKVGDNKIAMTTNKTQFTIDAEKETDVKGYAVDSEGDVYYSK